MGENQTVNWAVVGLGDIVRKRVGAAIKAQPASRLHACVTRNPRAREADLDLFAPRKVYRRMEPMLADPQVDAVYLATPVHLHASQAIACLKAGKDVLVEKPMARNDRESSEMCRVAEHTGRRLAVAYYRRFWPRFRFVKEILDQGRLGQIVSGRIAYGGWYRPDPSDPGAWRTDAELSGGGVLADVGCHRLDLVAWWFDLPKRLVANTTTLTHDYPVEDSASVLMVFEGGIQFTASFHWNSRTRIDEIDVVGTDGRLHLRPCDGPPLVITDADGRDETLQLPRPQNAHYPLIDDFTTAIIEGRAPRFSGSDGRKTTRIIDAAYDASRQESWIDLDR